MAERNPKPSSENDPEPISERNPGDALLAWVLPAFHLTSLLVVLVLALHIEGSLGSSLGGLGTAIGVVVYVLLWLTTAFTTQRTLAHFTIRRGQPSARGATAMAGVMWGSANGVLFLFSLGIGSLAYAMWEYGVLDTLTGGTLRSFLLVGPFALGIAFVVGAVIASAYILVDLAVLAVATWLADRCMATMEQGLEAHTALGGAAAPEVATESQS